MQRKSDSEERDLLTEKLVNIIDFKTRGKENKRKGIVNFKTNTRGYIL